MMQSFAMMAVITVLWALLSYSLAFDAGKALSAVCTTSFCTAWARRRIRPMRHDSAQTFMVYQMMFAIITPALITGAFAERMKFSAMVVFTGAVVDRGVCPDGAHGVGHRAAC